MMAVSEQTGLWLNEFTRQPCAEPWIQKLREDAFERMLDHAGQLGANAVIGVRYDATEVMQGVTEVLCYGTAATVERG